MKLAPRHLALTAALALALTACGSGEDETEPSAPATQSSETSTAPETEPADESAEATETPAEQSSAPETEAEDANGAAPHSAPVEEGVVPANPAPADMPDMTEDPAGGHGQGQQGQAQTGQPQPQPGQGGQSAQNPAGLSDQAYAHFQAGGVCFTDVFPAGIPSAPALQEIQDFCATTDPAAWDVTDGVPNPFGVPDPAL